MNWQTTLNCIDFFTIHVLLIFSAFEEFWRSNQNDEKNPPRIVSPHVNNTFLNTSDLMFNLLSTNQECLALLNTSWYAFHPKVPAGYCKIFIVRVCARSRKPMRWQLKLLSGKSVPSNTRGNFLWIDSCRMGWINLHTKTHFWTIAFFKCRIMVIFTYAVFWIVFFLWNGRRSMHLNQQFYD
jgi:hypothetical protein